VPVFLLLLLFCFLIFIFKRKRVILKGKEKARMHYLGDEGLKMHSKEI
jgi:hypothetical protein